MKPRNVAKKFKIIYVHVFKLLSTISITVQYTKAEYKMIMINAQCRPYNDDKKYCTPSNTLLVLGTSLSGSLKY